MAQTFHQVFMDISKFSEKSVKRQRLYVLTALEVELESGVTVADLGTHLRLPSFFLIDARNIETLVDAFLNAVESAESKEFLLYRLFEIEKSSLEFPKVNGKYLSSIARYSVASAGKAHAVSHRGGEIILTPGECFYEQMAEEAFVVFNESGTLKASKFLIRFSDEADGQFIFEELSGPIPDNVKRFAIAQNE